MHKLCKNVYAFVQQKLFADKIVVNIFCKVFALYCLKKESDLNIQIKAIFADSMVCLLPNHVVY